MPLVETFLPFGYTQETIWKGKCSLHSLVIKLLFCMNNGSEQANELTHCGKFIFEGTLKILTNIDASGGNFSCPPGTQRMTNVLYIPE